MNGNVTPVRGINLVTPPIIRKVWKAKRAVKPAHNRVRNLLRFSKAPLAPSRSISINIAKSPIANIEPNSSHMAANIKSRSTTGILVAYPLVRPIPVIPQVQIAKRDWAI